MAFGVNPARSETLDACRRNNELYDNTECSLKLNEANIKNYFRDHCFGKRSCSIDLRNQDFLGEIEIP